MVSDELLDDEGDYMVDDYQPPKREELTCYRCSNNKTCEFAWDHYNTNGDCLWLK